MEIAITKMRMFTVVMITMRMFTVVMITTATRVVGMMFADVMGIILIHCRTNASASKKMSCNSGVRTTS